MPGIGGALGPTLHEPVGQERGAGNAVQVEALDSDILAALLKHVPRLLGCKLPLAAPFPDEALPDAIARRRE